MKRRCPGRVAWASSSICLPRRTASLLSHGACMAHTLSDRGRALETAPPKSLATAYAARADRYDRVTNPAGYIDLSVSENHLSLPLLHAKLAGLPALPPDWLVYDASQGSLPFLLEISRLFARHFLPTGALAPSPDAFVTTAGAGAAVDLLATVLCDAEDAVLLPGPGYGGFARDLVKRACTKLVVAQMEPANRISVAAFDTAWKAAGGDQSRVRMMLITSPHNPTGEVLRAGDIRDLVAWGREHGLQMVFDEAYALSVYAEDARFCSVAHALNGELGDDVHIVWTFSKDFCWSGARAGVVYSQNDALLNAIRPALTYLAGVSRQTQWSLTQLLQDVEWVESFLSRNRQNLLNASRKSALLLAKCGVQFFPAEAGLFLWVDLRKWMRDGSEDEEMALWERMAEQKVLMTPASESFGNQYGFFRICFAAVDEDALQAAFERISGTVLAPSAMEAGKAP